MNIYLNTVPVEAEGATVFITDDTNRSTTSKVTSTGSFNQNEEESRRSCQGGELVVQPEEGAALLFYQVPPIS